MGRLGDLSEAAWKRFWFFWKRLEKVLALLGGGLEPRVGWRTISKRFGGGLEASCAVLKAC